MTFKCEEEVTLVLPMRPVQSLCEGIVVDTEVDSGAHEKVDPQEHEGQHELAVEVNHVDAATVDCVVKITERQRYGGQHQYFSEECL